MNSAPTSSQPSPALLKLRRGASARRLFRTAYIGVHQEWRRETSGRLPRRALPEPARRSETLPELRDQARLATTSGPAPGEATLDGASDAIAAAALQGRLQEMAARAGAPLSSAEALPGEAAGAWRRIGVRVSVSAPWPAVVRLLQAVGAASPRMLVDDLQLRAPPLLLRTGTRPMDAGFTVFAFRAEAPR